MVDSCLLPAEWNWLLKSFAKQDSSGVAKKNRCLVIQFVILHYIEVIQSVLK